jgi:hypothetical protein
MSPLGNISIRIKPNIVLFDTELNAHLAAIAQLGERQTEELKVTGWIPVRGISFHFIPKTLHWENIPILPRFWAFSFVWAFKNRFELLENAE